MHGSDGMSPALGGDVGSAVGRMGPRQGKERRNQSEELSPGAWAVGAEVYGADRFKEAREVFEQVALDEDLIVFLTLPAYRLLD